MTNSFFVAGSVNQTASGEMYHVVRDYSIWWQIPQYTLMGMSEVFTSIPGEEMYHMTTAAILCLQFCKIIILRVGGGGGGGNQWISMSSCHLPFSFLASSLPPNSQVFSTIYL